MVMPLAAFQWADFITPLSLVGALYAAFIAIRQDDLKDWLLILPLHTLD